MDYDKIKKLQTIISGSDTIVFFGGAGVSTESGIKDFRSVDGLYAQTYEYPPETILSHHFFVTHTAEFYEFYKDKMLCPDVLPNKTHVKLTELERTGKLKAVITQNIDGLHQRAGTKNVLELHGSVMRNFCMDCNAFYEEQYVRESVGVPHCKCGGVIKPDVVLYEEMLDEGLMARAVDDISNADTLIIGGTSLVVYPAAGLINYFRGSNLIVINKMETSQDANAALVINDSIGAVMGQIAVE